MNPTTSAGADQLKELMEQCDVGSSFDLHDAYGVGVRQAVGVLLRVVDGLTPTSLDSLTAQFRAQRQDAATLMVILANFAYCVRESPMCVAHAATDALVLQGVECGRLLVLADLIDSYVARPRWLTERDVHEAGMKAYAWLMNLAARQLDDESYDVWYEQWCQIPGQMPWNLSQYAQTADIEMIPVFAIDVLL